MPLFQISNFKSQIPVRLLPAPLQDSLPPIANYSPEAPMLDAITAGDLLVDFISLDLDRPLQTLSSRLSSPNSFAPASPPTPSATPASTPS